MFGWLVDDGEWCVVNGFGVLCVGVGCIGCFDVVLLCYGCVGSIEILVGGVECGGDFCY